MVRTFDDIDQILLGALRATLSFSKQAEFCVGYLNLGGWQAVDDLVQPWSAKAALATTSGLTGKEAESATRGID